MQTTEQIEKESQQLITRVKSGDDSALETLIKLHEPFIYNLAWKYTGNPDEAKDLCQDVLIKIVTKLNTFKGESAFRTWVYRVLANEFLMTKRRPMEDRWSGFDDFTNELNQVPTPELSPEEEEDQILRTKTARTRCMSGMLMCLTREQRLIYLIGDVFKIDSETAADIFELTPANFRQKLARTRKEFHAFMNKQCGLVKLENPCRCSKKAKAMEQAGRMQTNAKLFDPAFSATVAKYVDRVADAATDEVDKKYIEFFQSHPTKEDFNADTVVKEIINDPNLHKYLDNFR